MQDMQENELIPGDVIFFENNYPGHDYVDHVAIYDGVNEHGCPMILHSIINAQGYYYSLNASGLSRTTLRALRNQIQREEGYPDVTYNVTYKVFRCRDEQIRNKAVELLRHQVLYRLPYDEQRLDEKLKREDEEGLDAEAFKELGKSRYRQAGIYRSIKYAARHQRMLTRTRDNGIGRGLTCSMTVILAYQIAELLLSNKVRPQDNAEWVSDKYAPVHGVYPESYLAYLADLRTHNYYPSHEPRLRLSYDYWTDTACLPEMYTHSTFAVDAKVIGAAGMFAYMTENTDAWEYKDVLAAEERQYSVAERQRNRRHNQDVFFRSVQQIHALSGNVSTMTSARPSSSKFEPEPDNNERSEFDEYSNRWTDQILERRADRRSSF